MSAKFQTNNIFQFYSKIIIIFLLYIIFSNPIFAEDYCPNLSDPEVERIISDLKAKRVSASELNICSKKSYKLFSDLIKINPGYFEYASLDIRNDTTFIKSFVKSYPQILGHISFELKSDPLFFESVIKIYDRALEYANYDLVDNFDFMEQMIKFNPDNFKYASSRLQDNKKLALIAVKKDGRMIKYASPRLKENKTIINEAKKSHYLALDVEFGGLNSDKAKAAKENYGFLENIDLFLSDNYGGIEVGPKGSRGYRIVNQAKTLDREPILDRKDFFKRKYLWNDNEKVGASLTTSEFRELSWKTDLRNQPNLVTAIDDFLVKEELDQNTIDAMSLISLWKISDKPEIVIFKIYLLRKVKNIYSKLDLNNTSYLVGIAVGNGNKKLEEEAKKKEKDKVAEEGKGDNNEPKKFEVIPEENLEQEPNNLTTPEGIIDEKESPKSDPKDDSLAKDEENKKEPKKEAKIDNKIIDQDSWTITIIDSALDVDFKDDIILKNSHKQYDFWDIYQNKEDKISNLIFRVQDRNSEYIEIFSKQKDNIYRSIFKGGGYSFD